MDLLLPIDGEPLAVSLEEPPGATTAVLYLHGLNSHQAGEKAAHFRRRFVEAGFAFCSLDFRGHGRSGGDMPGLTLARNLVDARRAHDALVERGHERVVVFGSSMGGLTGLWHATRTLAPVLAMVAIAPALSIAESFLAYCGPEKTERWRREGRMRFEDKNGACDLGWGLIEDLEAHPVERLIELFRTPSLVFQGQRDDRVDWRRVQQFAHACPPGLVDLRLFPDGDHQLNDRLDALFEATLAFLDRLKR